MKKIIFFLLVASLLIPSKAAERPNFILIYVDDLGWADTSVPMMDGEPDSHSDFNQTPHLEKLAKRGMKFSNAYAPAPTCTPSRKSIQFGKTPARLGYTFVHDVLALQRELEWKGEVSLADVLKAADSNYVAAHFGKGMSNERMDTIGYDITDEVDGNATNGNFHGEYVSLKTKIPLPRENPKRMPELKDRSVQFIEEHSGTSPFFLMVSHYAVHVPHAASPELIEKYRNLPRGKYLSDEDYLPVDEMPKVMTIHSWRLQYAAMLEEVDQGLGAMVEALNKSGELDNTYIIFTSDNGGGLTPNGALSGGKANLYEGGLRVPFVIAGPGVEAGVQCDAPISQWDLLPTFHDLAESEAPLPQDLDGGSLRNLFENGNRGTVERAEEAFVFHYPCYFAPPLSVIRLGDYKLMQHLLTGEQKLFNVAEDYAEEKNLIYEESEVALRLQKHMESYLAEIDAEDVADVYAARFAELDRFEAIAKENHARVVERAAGDAKEIEAAKKSLEEKLERFARNRRDCKEQMKGTTF